LPEFIAAAPQTPRFIVEGEKDVDNLMRAGLVATCNVAGAKKWREEYNPFFAGRHVVIIPDNDEPGSKHAAMVVGHLKPVAASVKLLELTGLAEKGDVSDWLNLGGLGHTAAELMRLAEAKEEWQPEAEPAKGEAEAASEPKKNQATLLFELIKAKGVELFHDSNKNAYATLPINGHKENWPVRSMAFRDLVDEFHYEAHGSIVGTQAKEEAINLCNGLARIRGKEEKVWQRWAEDADGNIWLDLGRPDWQAVKVTKDGWQVVADCPVKFSRSSSNKPGAFPLPEQSGKLAELRDFINVHDEEWIVLAGWLVTAARPKGPYFVAAVNGEQGSAKSTLALFVKNLLDEDAIGLRSAPTKDNDFWVAAKHSRILAYDNMSSVPTWLSDELCKLATGGSFAKRQNYTDSEEAIITACRPVVFTGIGELPTRGDLLSRALFLTLLPIPEEKRLTEKELQARWQAARPRILGGLLTALSCGLANLDKVKLDKLPRMADGMQWVTACEPELGQVSITFAEAYKLQQANGLAQALEASEFAGIFLEWVETVSTFEGTASALLEEINGYYQRTSIAHLSPRNLPGWPKTPHHLSNALTRLGPSLRARGLEVVKNRTDKERTLQIRRVGVTLGDAGDAGFFGATTPNGDAIFATPITNDADYRIAEPQNSNVVPLRRTNLVTILGGNGNQEMLPDTASASSASSASPTLEEVAVLAAAAKTKNALVDIENHFGHFSNTEWQKARNIIRARRAEITLEEVSN